jgi:hypothetical protein
MKDYEEVSGTEINRKLLTHSLQHLNILRDWGTDRLGPISKSTQGISADSQVQLSQNRTCRADQVTIGSTLKQGGRVEGVIIFRPQDGYCYKMSPHLKVTGRQIIKDNRCWQEASRFVWNKQPIDNELYYGFLTQSGFLVSGTRLLADVCDGLSPIALLRQEQIISRQLGICDV